VNAGRPRTVRTPTNDDAIITGVEREPWRTEHDTAREVSLSQLMVLEVLYEDQFSCTTNR
jgi:hypothetical protein